MPRPKRPPRLWLRKSGRSHGWIILDGGRQHRTGCSAGDREGAERALARYIASKYQPARETELDRLPVPDVINVYLTEHAPHTRSLDFLLATASPIIDWWGKRHLSDIRASTCREYVAWRTAQGVSDQTARHDLKTLRAAIRYYHANHGPLNAVPVVTLPAKSEPRSRWLTRSEAARLLWAARRIEHLKRFILIGLYSGTRSEAILGLRWLPSMDSGWFDLDAGVLYRRGAGERETRKRRPPVKIHARLMPWLRRWQAADLANGICHVCHYKARPIEKLRRSWSSARHAAGLARDVTPHVLRHTRVTWSLQAGVPTWEVAGFVGMSEETVRQVYGHHSPEHQAQAAKS